MKKIELNEMEQFEGGNNLACFAAGATAVFAAANWWNPSVFVFGSYTVAFGAACFMD